MMSEEKRKNLVAIKESIEILKDHSDSLEDNDNKIDEEDMKKLVHMKYNSFVKEEDEKGFVK